MNAKEYLESKGVFGLDTKKRYNEVIGWMEGYAQEVVKNCSIPAVSSSALHDKEVIEEKCSEKEELLQQLQQLQEKIENHVKEVKTLVRF